MEESYQKGVATHLSPESCLDDPRGRGEALTGGSTGGLWITHLDALSKTQSLDGSRHQLTEVIDSFFAVREEIESALFVLADPDDLRVDEMINPMGFDADLFCHLR